MPKESLKDKLDGNELDLSMSNMVTVPVKELAALPKATVLDLSNNSIIQLPDDFCTLTHIVKLDLSKNSLTQLPERFGALQKLQHLDLLGNLLTTLPVSMTHLKNLKWLDLKDNPLDENLKDIVGNCLDDTECKRCAKNVVSYYKTVESNLERERQRKLKEDREIESKRKAEEEKVRQRKKAEKQLEKDRRRKEYQLKQQEKEQLQSQGAEYDQSDTRVNDGRGDEMAEKKRDEVSCWSVVVKSVVSLLVVFVALYVFCEYNPLNQTCRDVRVQLKAINLKAEELFENFFENTLKVAD